MLGIYLGTYVLLLALLWGFFFIARHHTMRFKHFSTNITPMTNLLMIVLAVLSCLGGVLIFMLDSQSPSITRNEELPAVESYY